MSAGEIFTGVAAGVGTTAVVYAVRLMRRMAADLTREVKAIVAAPAEVKELRAAVTTNTAAIGNLSNTTANLSAALERLTRIAEKRANGS